ncbi:hypothetical protein ID850_19020 [Xenorhabdus sp. Flor]|uniref:hypothetical protein n=1 Tax=Xenorhabdus cabanillasii TaxID=351673 RepID=UPI00198D3C76|nr:hypothetical protein [Xenorhabdus sp. Flor]MBD2816764.1 hypothetical protein [Xenorhabdus sp. Flor]
MLADTDVAPKRESLHEPRKFIEKNVQAELIKLGFSSSVAGMASDRAKEHYRRSASASRKGKLFDGDVDNKLVFINIEAFLQ